MAVTIPKEIHKAKDLHQHADDGKFTENGREATGKDEAPPPLLLAKEEFSRLAHANDHYKARQEENLHTLHEQRGRSVAC